MSTYQLVGMFFALLGVATIAMLAVEANRARSLDLKDLPMTNKLMWVVRITVGVLFIYSGFVKANDYTGFAYKLDEYFTVFGQHFPPFKGFFDLFLPLTGPMAWFISVFEIALAVALIVGWRMNLTAWLLVLMMVFFTILTGYSHVTGAVTDCGCFGDALKLAPWESFVKDIILMAVLVPLFLVRRSIPPFPNERIATAATAASFLLSGAFSYYCHETLPLIDYRPYKDGVDLNICTTEITDEGYAKCKDWVPYFPDGNGFEMLQGKTLMIIVYRFEKAPEKAMREAVELAQSLRGSAIRPVIATATPSSETRQTLQALGYDQPFVLMDETVLKTIIRSHPGYMLLDEGVVIDKWHYNYIPDRAELERRLKER
jgi:uncharacterized membrane protein YphA (DoxX/SURF4 family)